MSKLSKEIGQLINRYTCTSITSITSIAQDNLTTEIIEATFKHMVKCPLVENPFEKEPIDPVPTSPEYSGLMPAVVKALYKAHNECSEAQRKLCIEHLLKESE